MASDLINKLIRKPVKELGVAGTDIGSSACRHCVFVLLSFARTRKATEMRRSDCNGGAKRRLRIFIKSISLCNGIESSVSQHRRVVAMEEYNQPTFEVIDREAAPYAPPPGRQQSEPRQQIAGTTNGKRA